MKKIFLPFVFICSLSTSFSQGLEFNRSIDTLIIANTIQAGTQINFTDYSVSHDLISSSISPPNGKVWKIQSIVISTNINPCISIYSFDYNSGSVYQNFCNADLKLKNNEIDLVKIGIQDAWNSSYYVQNLPIWINSNSNLMLGLRHENSTQPLYMSVDYSGIMIWFSVLEFNEN